MTVHTAKDLQTEPIRYSILDPTGNVTALVETDLPESRQKEVAAVLMELHPEVEQVGFTDFEKAFQTKEHSFAGVRLHMAGGEFCGNAAMCTAALYLIRSSCAALEDPASELSGRTGTVTLEVSGATRPVDVFFRQKTDTSFCTGIFMPPALEIAEEEFCYGEKKGMLPVVFMEGITHVIVESASPFYRLQEDAGEAECALRTWCGQLNADCLGLMFLEKSAEIYHLTPLVYVPGSGTVFWENSCASGSSAVGMYLAAKNGEPVDLFLEEPGGTLRVESLPEENRTCLQGTVRLIGHFLLP